MCRTPERAKAFDPDYEGPYALSFGGEGGRVGDAAYPADLGKRDAVFRNPLSDREKEHVRRLYAGDVASVDDLVPTLREALARRSPTWWVVFASDHGESMGEHPHYAFDHGDYVDHGTLHVPMAFIGPAARAQALDTTASLVDLAPTLAQLVRWKSFPSDGRSLAAAVLTGMPLPDMWVYAESGHSHYIGEIRGRTNNTVAGRFRAVRRGRFKLTYAPDIEQLTLHDVVADPGEHTDLYAPDHPAMVDLLPQLQRHLGEDPMVDETPELTDDDREALRALGYLE